VWQLDVVEFEITRGGTWRIAACRDYWSKHEFGWYASPTANPHDAIATIELAITEAERLLGCTLLELATDPETGAITPFITIVTGNGGPFRSF
jgi:putative transposase